MGSRGIVAELPCAEVAVREARHGEQQIARKVLTGGGATRISAQRGERILARCRAEEASPTLPLPLPLSHAH